MQLDVFFLSSLRCNVALDFSFASVAADGADVIPVRPEFPAPEVLLDCGYPEENLASRDAFNRPDNLCRAIGRDGLHEEMDMVAICADLDKHEIIPHCNLQTDISERPVHFGREYRSPILGGAHDMIQQARNVMATMNMLAHTPEYIISTRQAAGNEPGEIQLSKSKNRPIPA